jgi:Uma2 family endonuclease
MSQALRHPWTEAEFFAWLQTQETRHELVDGEPRAMTGATQRHDRIVVNLLTALVGRLRGSRCRTGTGDTAIRIPGGNIRHTDAAVDCGRFEESARAATEPVLVAEVFSPSTADFDQTEKLEEYRSVPSLRHILVIDSGQPRLRLHTRGSDGHWTSVPQAGLEAEVVLSVLGIALPLAELYDGLTFRPRRRLVPTPEGPDEG